MPNIVNGEIYDVEVQYMRQSRIDGPYDQLDAKTELRQVSVKVSEDGNVLQMYRTHPENIEPILYAKIQASDITDVEIIPVRKKSYVNFVGEKVEVVTDLSKIVVFTTHTSLPLYYSDW